MSSGLTIRPEVAEDEAAVRSLVADAFGDEALAALLDDLRASVAWLGLSFVAELDDEVVGHIAYTRAWVDDPAELVEVLVLSPLSIRPDHASKGIGTALVTESIEALAGRGEPLLFLEGDPGFYSRLGFVEGTLLGFKAPSVRIPGPAFQVRTLPGRPGQVKGALVYPDVWWRHDAVGLRPEWPLTDRRARGEIPRYVRARRQQRGSNMAKAVSAILDRRSLMKGAAVLGVASAVTVGAAERASAAPVALDPSPGAGVTNRVALQAAIDATPAGGFLVLPDGPFEIDVTSASLTLSSSICITGALGSKIDVYPKTATTMPSLFTVSTSVTNGHYTIENLEIAGPTSSSGGGSAIQWVKNGATGTISLFQVKITGQFQYGVRRSGIGLVNLIAVEIEARGSGLQITDVLSGASGLSRCAVTHSRFTGTGSAPGSIGIELHQHISLQCASTTFESLGKAAISVANGSQPAAKTWTVTDCHVIDSDLAVTGSAHAVFTRVKQQVDPSHTVHEMLLRGPVTFNRCDLRGGGSFTLAPGQDVVRRFQSCWFEPRSTLLVAGTSLGQIVFDDCRWRLTGAGRAMYLSGLVGATRIRRSTISDCGTSSTVLTALAGTLVFTATTVDSAKSNHGLTIRPAVTQVGSPTLTNTGVCPTPPAL